MIYKTRGDIFTEACVCVYTYVRTIPVAVYMHQLSMTANFTNAYTVHAQSFAAAHVRTAVMGGVHNSK